VIVFLRTQEEAVWTIPSNFVFTAPLVTLTSGVSLSYDLPSDSNIATVSFNGPAPASTSEVTVLVDGK